MTDIILHHYDVSPFGRKVRAALGYKQLAWRSCVVAMQPPRAVLSTLAGGYRRIPVLQVGADVFCDSNLILRVLDRIAPARPLRGQDDVLSQPISQWFEPRMFSIFSVLRFRSREDAAGSFESDAARANFLRDRAAFMAPLLDVRKNAERSATCAAEARIFVAYLEERLGDGRAYLQGAAPTHADFSAFHPLHWLIEKSAHRELLSEFTRVWAWVERLSALGEGTRSEASEADALRIAHDATPSFSFEGAAGPGDPALGTRVRIAPTDYGVDAVEGELHAIGRDHLSIRRTTGETGLIAQHFPRWGYRIDPV